MCKLEYFVQSLRKPCLYCRLFGPKCAKCFHNFQQTDYVMRVRNKIFHIDCFRCAVCDCPLQTGDDFALRDDGLYCKSDIDAVEHSATSGRFTPQSPGACVETLEDIKDIDNVVVSDAKCADGSDNSSAGEHASRDVTALTPERSMLRGFTGWL